MLVFIGLGSNLQDPLRQVITASEELRFLQDTHFCQASSCYQSSPLGPSDQPDYINRVVSMETRLAPELLLDQLQAIEKKQGRERLRHWGPRTIDLDILLFGQQVIATPRLTVPHPGLKERSFFLYPLVEIAPHLILPSGEKVLDLIHKLTDRSAIQRLPN
ncbi:MAG: 2-amino-4-hydroxy-6-hydroxymethyldihydropteridine diphosphokinase [Proteobacteria bacterium]|nr:2-amino-4-hydroxy-6-hydroxymethyldihydropteridine diphosphokinase [Pseudomonadota bacterium]